MAYITAKRFQKTNNKINKNKLRNNLYQFCFFLTITTITNCFLFFPIDQFALSFSNKALFTESINHTNKNSSNNSIISSNLLLKYDLNNYKTIKKLFLFIIPLIIVTTSGLLITSKIFFINKRMLKLTLSTRSVRKLKVDLILSLRPLLLNLNYLLFLNLISFSYWFVGYSSTSLVNSLILYTIYSFIFYLILIRK